MKVFHKFLGIVSITIAAGGLTYAAIQVFHLPNESILVIICAAVLCQALISLECAKRLDAERQEALDVIGRICKNELTIGQDTSISVLMSKIEALFRETLSRERKVVENAADLICIVSTDGTILRANAAAKSILGYKAEELLGQKLASFTVAENREDNLHPLLGAAESIQKIEMENQFRKKDGRIIDMLWSAHWSATDNGLFCVAHDITERKQAAERVRLILESLPAGVCVLGLSGQIQFINKTARQLCLIAEGEELKERANTIFTPCPEPFSIDQFIKDMLASVEAVVTNTNRADLPVEISARKMDWEGLPACLVMFVDVSEKRAAEKAKQEFLAMRDESLALRRKLMDMVVHDIRTPLASLLSTQELLLLGVGVNVEEKLKTRLEICHDEVKRIIRLINDLLKISRHEVTKLNLTRAEANIESLIVLAASSIQDLAKEKSVKIVTNTVRARANVDSDRILQVLFNLLSNAIKFSPPNTVITVSSVIENEFVQISVSDQGKGIPEGSETSIFLPYSQVSWKDSVEKGGTGLGLTICREIVEEHGGIIGVSNNTEGGARFCFTIPLTEAGETPALPG